jgi:hypothetical protein
VTEERLHDLGRQFAPAALLWVRHRLAKKFLKACRVYFGSPLVLHAFSSPEPSLDGAVADATYRLVRRTELPP